MGETVGMAGVAAALSVVSDLARGHPPGEAMRGCLLATELARRAGLDGRRQGEVYYGTLMRCAGCAATSHESALLTAATLHAEPQSVMADGEGHVAVLVRLSASRPDGRTMDGPQVVLMTVEGGGVRAIEQFVGDPAAVAHVLDRSPNHRLGSHFAREPSPQASQPEPPSQAKTHLTRSGPRYVRQRQR